MNIFLKFLMFYSLLHWHAVLAGPNFRNSSFMLGRDISLSSFKLWNHRSNWRVAVIVANWLLHHWDPHCILGRIVNLLLGRVLILKFSVYVIASLVSWPWPWLGTSCKAHFSITISRNNTTQGSCFRRKFWGLTLLSYWLLNLKSPYLETMLNSNIITEL